MTRLALAAALLVVPVAPASAAPKNDTRVYVFDRVRPRAGSIYVKAEVETSGDYAFTAAATAIVGRDGRYYDVTGMAFFGVTSERKSIVGPTSGLPVCVATPNSDLCREPTGGYGGGYFAGDRLFNRVFLVLHGQIKSVGFSLSPGWKLSRWNGRVQLVSGADALMVHAAKQFRLGQWDDRVTAPGGPHGSIALGDPPSCVNGLGLGDTSLRGGDVDVEAHCQPPPNANVPPPASYAQGRTTWTWEGNSTGLSDVATRLVVLDLP